MLLEFTFGNYRSFKEIVTFSMIGSSSRELIDSNVIKEHKYNLLKSAIIYGANASGKSNFIKAIKFFRKFILNSISNSLGNEEINVENFKLSTQNNELPSVFEIIFLIEKIRYRYGFKVNRKSVEEEWLFYVPSTKEGKLFTREGDKITLGLDFREGKGLESKTRSNVLFLSVVAQWNGKISSKIIEWLNNKVSIISGINDNSYKLYTIKKLSEDILFKDFVLKYLKVADIGISNIDTNIEKLDFGIDDLPKLANSLFFDLNNSSSEILRIELNMLHPKFDNKNNVISHESFSHKMESDGTIKLLSLAGPIWDTIKNGKILFIDEFEARLHQKLIESLLKLFNSKTVNINKAQFILASHDTSVLRSDIFRRDQIWFVNKNKFGSSELYSLAEYKINRKIERKDASYSKNYLTGRYGAIPVIYDFEKIFEN